jgi:hypothetical protein
MADAEIGAKSHNAMAVCGDFYGGRISAMTAREFAALIDALDDAAKDLPLYMEVDAGIALVSPELYQEQGDDGSGIMLIAPFRP